MTTTKTVCKFHHTGFCKFTVQISVLTTSVLICPVPSDIHEGVNTFSTSAGANLTADVRTLMTINSLLFITRKSPNLRWRFKNLK